MGIFDVSDDEFKLRRRMSVTMSTTTSTTPPFTWWGELLDEASVPESFSHIGSETGTTYTILESEWRGRAHSSLGGFKVYEHSYGYVRLLISIPERRWSRPVKVIAVRKMVRSIPGCTFDRAVALIGIGLFIGRLVFMGDGYVKVRDE